MTKTQERCSIRFDRAASQSIKGIAILLMLFHHCFLRESLFADYAVSFWPFPQSYVVAAAAAAKICVSLFAFVSGYGLLLSYRSRQISAVNWAASRYVKTFSGYWFIWLLSAVITQLIDGRFARIFFSKDIWNGLLHAVIDFLGLSNLFGVSQLGGAWWYMSACFAFILLTPLLAGEAGTEKRLPLSLLLVVVVPRILQVDLFVVSGKNPAPFLFCFTLGMLFAEYGLMERIVNGKRKWLRFAVELLLLAAFLVSYGQLATDRFWELKWGLFPLVVILFSTEFLIGIPGLRQVLQFLGRHSMNIFLIHSFIRGIYLTDFTYAWRHFLPIVAVLLVVSLVLSLLLENLKSLLKYDAWIRRICGRIEQL